MDQKEPTKQKGARLILILGFGGMLGLMGFAAVQTERLLSQIRARGSGIEGRFLARNKSLTEIRSALYLSGTIFRDYVLDRDATRSEAQLRRLDQMRREMDRRVEEYESGILGGEEKAFVRLKTEIANYWRVLNPALSWDSARRGQEGFQFLRDQVFPKRAAVLDLADQVAAFNERQLVLGQGAVAELFTDVRMRLRWTLAGLAGLGLVLAMLAGRRILELQREAGARFQQAEQARAELRELSSRLLDVQEEERRALSRELHDEVGQSLSAVMLAATNLSAGLRTGAMEEAPKHVETIRRLTESSVATVRNMSLLLRPSMLDDLGLLPALEWQAREISRRTEMEVSIDGEDVPANLTEQAKTCVYRVAQEALHNAERHSGATSATVTLRREGGRLLLKIADNGRGFDPERHKGLGLLGMEERVVALGGIFEIQSRPGAGTVVDIYLSVAG